jgi:LCP family protein required for cell wall assembly
VACVLLLGNGSSGGPGPTPSATPTETLTPLAIPDERLTVLLIGKDLDAEREARGDAINTDTLMLASVSADRSAVSLIGVPRDTVDVPLPGGGTWERKINSLHAREGADALVGAMEEFFGVPIDGYAALDMDDFATLVDAAGGVMVDVAEPISDRLIDLELDSGRQTLDGETALKYVRTRVDLDYGRMARQQQVLVALVRRLTDPAAPIDLASVIAGLESLETDLPLEHLPTIVELARQARDAEVTEQVLGPPDYVTFEGDRGDGRGYVVELDLEAVRAYARRQLTE